MNTQTVTVRPEELARTRTRIRRAGGTIVRSAPVGRGYAVTFVTGGAR